MRREDDPYPEISAVREQVGILAEQVGRLLDMISRQSERGADTGPAEDKLAVLESLMWKLHVRHNRLKADMGFGQVGRLLH